jgi:hypothetical protein
MAAANNHLGTLNKMWDWAEERNSTQMSYRKIYFYLKTLLKT